MYRSTTQWDTSNRQHCPPTASITDPHRRSLNGCHHGGVQPYTIFARNETLFAPGIYHVSFVYWGVDISFSSSLPLPFFYFIFFSTSSSSSSLSSSFSSSHGFYSHYCGGVGEKRWRFLLKTEYRKRSLLFWFLLFPFFFLSGRKCLITFIGILRGNLLPKVSSFISIWWFDRIPSFFQFSLFKKKFNRKMVIRFTFIFGLFDIPARTRNGVLTSWEKAPESSVIFTLDKSIKIYFFGREEVLDSFFIRDFFHTYFSVRLWNTLWNMWVVAPKDEEWGSWSRDLPVLATV